MAKTIILMATLFALSTIQSTAIPFTKKDLKTEECLKSLFESWLSHHGFNWDLDKKAKWFNAFKDNVKYIHEFNKQDNSYELMLNKFSAMTVEEFRNTYASSKIDHYRLLRGEGQGSAGSFRYEKVKKLPPVDWRLKGAVTTVKNQGQCGMFFDIAKILVNSEFLINEEVNCRILTMLLTFVLLNKLQY